MEGKEYVSNSTLDRPPKQEKDSEKPEQQDLIPEQTDLEKFEDEIKSFGVQRNFEIDLTLKVKSQKTYTIPLLSGDFPNTSVMEVIKKAIASRRNINVIEAALDLPLQNSNGVVKTSKPPIGII